MIELRYEINGKAAGTPINAEEIKLKTDWTNNNIEDKSEAEISTNSLQFALEDAKAINDHIGTGLIGGVGIMEGVPYKIFLKDRTSGIEAEILDGYIDLVDEHTIVSCDQVDSIIKKRKTLDWLTARADGYSFAYLASIGEISPNDYVPVPYVLNYRPEAYAVVMISMSIFMTTKALLEAIRGVTEAIAALTEVLSVGLSVDIGDAIAAAMLVVANVAYAVALVIALVNMTAELIDQLFPPVRRYLGMKLERMFEVGFAHIGLKFQSTIFQIPKWKNAVYLSNKSERGGILGKTNGVGHPNQQSSVYNFGDFLRVMKEAFNAQIKIEGDTVYFERTDFWDSKSTWVKPDVINDQTSRLNQFQYNAEELLSNLMLSFTTDVQDENTLESFLGTNYQVITQPNIVSNQDYVNMKGFGEVRLPFARATRKDELTGVEKLLKNLAQVVDKTVNTLGGNSQLVASIDNRKAMMVQSADTISVDKLLIMENERIPSKREDQLNASDFWDFHIVNSFAEINDPITGQTIHNQYKVYNGERIPFCYTDWLSLLRNNRFTTVNGEQGEVLSIEWDLQNDEATIDYKIKHLYTKNLKLVFLEGV